MGELWTSLLTLIGGLLTALHDLASPLFGTAYAWGIAIILLTVVVRVLLLPLAIKQINSMRAMQGIQPELKKIQKKYKADRSLMRTDPEKYKAQRQKQQEAMMALYKEHNVNPASSCLPLVAQMPIFVALFSVLRSPDVVPQLQEVGFFLIPSLAAQPSQGLAAAGVGAYILMVLMAVSTFVSQRQMMGRTPTAGDQAQQQQKIMLYVMPLMLTVFSWNFPIGVLLYWVTTNLWTMGQQWFMFRNVEQNVAVAGAGTRPPSKGRG